MTILPNLIGIGGQKCASTWMSECLRSHPDIYMSSPKELRYFTDNEVKGLRWYLEYFKDAGQYTYRGEFSSNYIYWLDSADKIYSELGHVKIVAVVRKPSERVLSHIKHLIRDGALNSIAGEIGKDDLQLILKEFPAVFYNSLYYHGLEKYISIFGTTSVFVVDQETCKKNPNRVLSSLWGFLGVSQSVNIAEADLVVSRGINPRLFWLELLRRKVFLFAKDRAPWLINWVKRTGVSSLYRHVNEGRALNLSAEAVKYCDSVFEDDWSATQALLTVR